MWNLSTSKITFQELTDTLVEKNHLNKTAVEDIAQVLFLNSFQSIFLPLRILIVISALFFCIGVTALLFITNLLEQAAFRSYLILGAMYILTAILLNFLSKRQTKIERSFFIFNASFFFMIAGKVLFVWGFAKLVHLSHYGDISLALLIVGLPTYVIYKVYLDQFFTSLAFFMFLTATIFSWFPAQLDLVHYLLFSFLVILSTYLSTNKKLSPFYTPLTLSLSIYLFLDTLLFVLYLFPDNSIAELDYSNMQHLNIITVILAIALIYIISWTVGGWRKMLNPLILILCLAIFLLSFTAVPAILYCLILIILGFRKSNNFLLWLGIITFPIILSCYIYSLDFNLFIKSLVLIGSGCTLFAGKFFLKTDQSAKGVA